MIPLSFIFLTAVVFIGVAIVSERWTPLVGIGGLLLVMAVLQMI